MENRTKITQKEKQLLFKDLSARLPYHVRLKVWLKDGTTEEGFLDLEHNYADVLLDAFYYNEIKDIKPYLRSLSSMTEEEAKEIATLHEIVDILSIKHTDKYIDITVDDGFGSTERRIIWYDEIISSIEIFDLLNKKHFDYRGLIPMGLAIEVTKENNPYK